MTEAGEQFGETTPYGTALIKVAQTENRLGQAERELCGQAATNTLLPIRRFLEGDMKTIQAEADVRVAQAEFDKQSEITKLLLEGIQTAHNNQLKCLRDFVEAQMSFYAQAHQLMADLQRELSGCMCYADVSVRSPIRLCSLGIQADTRNDLLISQRGLVLAPP
uniref:BAR domain-containing protein n=1 Tax=Caenorhabditis japonica TaxID=281687 RepID=A0A8R1EPU3_CAEJA